MSTDLATQYVLPPVLIGRADVARIVREVETVDNDIEAQRVRAKEENIRYQMPTMSRSLNEFLDQNKLDISDDQTRMKVKENLRMLKDKAPILHMTFAAEADPEFIQHMANWVRTEIHPQALLSVGLQPSLVGGVYLRTPNHVHDFSVRELLKNNHGIIVNDLEQLSAG